MLVHLDVVGEGDAGWGWDGILLCEFMGEIVSNELAVVGTTFEGPLAGLGRARNREIRSCLVSHALFYLNG